MSNGTRIGGKLLAAGMTKAGAAGVLGNLQAESAMLPTNVQDSFERATGYTNDSYTAAVDNGKITPAIWARDGAGYGIAQFTHHSIKSALLTFAKKRGTSVGDLDMQTDFLIAQLRAMPNLWEILCNTKDIRAASDAMLIQYERPADQSEAQKAYRAKLAASWYSVLSGMEEKTYPKPEAPAVTFASCRPTLPVLVKCAAYSEAVKSLQILLQGKKYAVGQVDGYFGSATLQALQNFQNSEGLTPDGICGPATWAALIKNE